MSARRVAASTPRHAAPRVSPVERALAAVGRAVLAATQAPAPAAAPTSASSVVDMTRVEACEPLTGEYEPSRVVHTVAPLPQRSASSTPEPECEPVIVVRTDQMPIVLELMRARQASAGHQVHQTPDVPCSCCAHLDYELAGLIDDEEATR